MQQVRINQVKRNLIGGLLLNSCLAFIKFIAGILGHSFALIADSIESFADVISSTIILLGFKYATKPPDKDHPYGHGKAEPLITFIIVLFLIGSSFFIIFHAIENFHKPHKIPQIWTLYVLFFIISTKEFFYQYSKRNSKKAESSLLNAEAEHHRSDVFTSLAAFIGISISILMGSDYQFADNIAAIIAGLIILFNAYSILRPALGEIMDEHIYSDFVKEIKASTIEVNGALATDKCFVRKQGMYYLIDLHLVVDGKISVDKGHEIAHRVKKHLKTKYPNIEDVLIHIEPFRV